MPAYSNEAQNSAPPDPIRDHPEARLIPIPANKNPLTTGRIEANSVGIGEVSGEMVADRAKELGLIAGRPVNRVDYETAANELAGDPGPDAEQALLESVPEEERASLLPDTTGGQVVTSAEDEEDEDGRDVDGQLVEEGVREAAHDQRLQSALAAKAKNLPGD